MKGSSRSAFSLIELLVVVAILGILVGIFFTGFSYVVAKQNEKQAKMEIVALKTAVDSYKLEHGAYPNCPGTLALPANVFSFLGVSIMRKEPSKFLPIQRRFRRVVRI